MLPCKLSTRKCGTSILSVRHTQTEHTFKIRFALSRDCFPSELTASGAERSFDGGIVLCFLKPTELHFYGYVSGIARVTFSRPRFHANERDRELSGRRLHECWREEQSFKRRMCDEQNKESNLIHLIPYLISTIWREFLVFFSLVTD